MNKKIIFSLFFLAFFFASPHPGILAHPLSPTLWQWVETTPGHITMSWQTSAAKIPGEDFSPVWPESCQKVK